MRSSEATGCSRRCDFAETQSFHHRLNSLRRRRFRLFSGVARYRVDGSSNRKKAPPAAAATLRAARENRCFALGLQTILQALLGIWHHACAAPDSKRAARAFHNSGAPPRKCVRKKKKPRMRRGQSYPYGDGHPSARDDSSPLKVLIFLSSRCGAPKPACESESGSENIFCAAIFWGRQDGGKRERLHAEDRSSDHR